MSCLASDVRPREAMIENYGGMVDRWLARETEELNRKALSTASSSTSSPTWSYRGFNTELWVQKLASSRQIWARLKLWNGPNCHKRSYTCRHYLWPVEVNSFCVLIVTHEHAKVMTFCDQWAASFCKFKRLSHCFDHVTHLDICRWTWVRRSTRGCMQCTCAV